MAIDFELDNSERYTASSANITGLPATFACWFNPETITAHENLLLEIWLGSPFDALRLTTFGSSVIARSFDAAVETNASVTGLSTGSWQHLAAQFISSTSRFAFLDGTKGSEDTTSSAPSGMDNTEWGQTTDGLGQEVGIWDVALADDEIAGLAAGWSPLLIRPQNLVHYYPCWDAPDPLVDVMGNINLTRTNTPVKADHHPLIYPTVPLIGRGGPQAYEQLAFRARNDDGTQRSP